MLRADRLAILIHQTLNIKSLHSKPLDLDIEQPLAIVDIETTGGSPVNDRIIDISIIRLEKGMVIETFSSVLDPERYIPESIMALTGISELDIKRAPTFATIAQDIFNRLEGCIFVAHNARFDYSFLKSELKRFGITYTAKCLCTVKLSRSLFPTHQHHDLSSIIDRCNITCITRHRALPDALAVLDFLKFCQLYSPTRKKFTQVIERVVRQSALPLGLLPNMVEQLPEQVGVYIFYGEEGNKLYVGKSINIKTRVKSHFLSGHVSSKELKIIQEIRDIEAISTSGELSALLLESYLIKKEQPIYNRLSRHSKKLFVLYEHKNASGYKTVTLECNQSEKIIPNEKIIGIFRSKLQANKVLQQYAREYILCPKLLGLEKTRHACFYTQVRKCHGACIELELSEKYNARFDQAFSERRMKVWPFTSPVLIDEKNVIHPEQGTVFIVDNWRLLGSYVYDDSGYRRFLDLSYIFDYDSYKILSRYILLNTKGNNGNRNIGKNIKQISTAKVNNILDYIQ